MHARSRVLIAVLLAVPLALQAQSSWPVFQQNAQHTGVGLTDGAGIPKIEWAVTDIPGGTWGSPIIDSQGNILLTNNGGSDQLIAFDPDTGAVVWTGDLGAWSDSTPAVAPDGTIYVGSSTGDLSAFNAGGTPKWSAPMSAAVHGRPTLDSAGNIYVHNEGGEILSISDTGSGIATNWVYTTPETESSWRTAITLSSDESLAFYKREKAEDSRLLAINTADGTLAWEDTDGTNSWNIAGVCADGMLYQGFQNDLDGGGSIVKAYTGATGAVLWRFQPGIGSGFWGSDSGALSPDGSTLYVTWRGGGGLYAVNTADGTQRWKVWEGGNEGQIGDFFGTPCVGADGTVYIVDHNGTVAAYAPDGTELWRIEHPAGMTESWSAPTIGPDNALYVAGYSGGIGILVKFQGAPPPPPITVFETDFDTGYTAGTIEGQDGWTVTTGSGAQATVQSVVSVSGQALCVEGTADIVLERAIPNYAVLGYKRLVLEYDLLVEGDAPMEGGVNVSDSVVGDPVTTSWIAEDLPTINVPMDEQINVGRMTGQSPDGDALYFAFASENDTLAFLTEDERDFLRHYLDGGGAASWWYGPYVDFYLAGFTDDWIDITGGYRLEFDTRYFQDPDTNTNPYGDAPVFVRIYTYEDDGSSTWPTYIGFRDFSIVYATQRGDPPHPDWTRVFVDLANNFTEGGVFDPTRVSRMRFYGTDWAGGGDDFVDFDNMVLAPAVVTDIYADQGNDGTNESASHAVPGYFQGNWHHVKVELDFQQQRLAAMTVDGAGETTPTDIFFRKYGGEVAQGANRLRINLAALGGDDKAYIDNIAINAVPGFRVVSIDRGNSVTVEWQYMGPQEYYVVERSLNGPTGPFDDISGVLPVVTQYTDDDTGIADAFYRVGQYLTPPTSELFFEDFESGAAGWTHGGANDSWALGTPTDHTGVGGAPSSAYSGSYVYATDPTGDYNSDEDSWLLSPEIDLTGKAEAELSFYEWLHTENGDWEPVVVEMVIVGGETVELIAPRWGNHSGWMEQTADMGAGVGETVQLRFRFASDDSIELPGWYIDDVTVTTIP